MFREEKRIKKDRIVKVYETEKWTDKNIVIYSFKYIKWADLYHTWKCRWISKNDKYMKLDEIEVE